MAKSYRKTSADGSDGNKLLTSTRLEMIDVGSNRANASGPTGSTRAYAKGSGLSLSANFNPMKVPASTYGVNGV